MIVPVSLRHVLRVFGIAHELSAYGLGRRFRYVATGPSMLPTVEPGDHLLCTRTRLPEPGQLIVFRHPHRDIPVLKRVEATRAEAFWAVSDNPVGSDSRSFGWVAGERILGRVTLQLGRRGVTLY